MQSTVIINHENVNFRNIGHGETQHRTYKRLKLGGGQAYDWSYLDRGHILGQYMNIKHNLLYKTWADKSGVYTATPYLK